MHKLTQKEVEGLHKRLNNYIKQKELRSTGQRTLIADIFFRSHGHLTVDELLELVRKQKSKVGYATIYRTLRLLVESHIAYERYFEEKVCRYEIALENEHHDHLICTECNTIIEFENEKIETLQNEVAKKYGFDLTRHRLELYGVCPKCKK